MDASDSGEDGGRDDDAGLATDAGPCAPPRACGVAVPFVPKEWCTEALRLSLATCTTAGCYLSRASMESLDCYYCVASGMSYCLADWCPEEFVSADCCDPTRCSSCDAEDAPRIRGLFSDAILE